jgi:hypothetical protein
LASFLKKVKETDWLIKQQLDIRSEEKKSSFLHRTGRAAPKAAGRPKDRPAACIDARNIQTGAGFAKRLGVSNPVTMLKHNVFTNKHSHVFS